MKSALIRKIYLYLFSVVGLVLVIIGAVRLIDLGLKVYIFTEADRYYEYPARPKMIEPPDGSAAEAPTPAEVEEYQRKQQRSGRQRDAAGAIAQLIAGIPIYLYHWSLIKKEKENGN